MESAELFTKLVDLAQSFGIWIVFMYLYISEKRAHEQTRLEYRQDLREIAGLRQNLQRTQYYVEQARKFPREPEMHDFPEQHHG